MKKILLFLIILVNVVYSQTISWTTISARMHDSTATTLRISKNLSDLANTATARINLGVYSTGAVDSFLGTKLDTTKATALLRSQWSTAYNRSISVANDSTNWNTAYTDRMKWDGGSTGLVAATGRTSLGLGTMALADSILFKSWITSTYAPLISPSFTTPSLGNAVAGTLNGIIIDTTSNLPRSLRIGIGILNNTITAGNDNILIGRDFAQGATYLYHSAIITWQGLQNLKYGDYVIGIGEQVGHAADTVVRSTMVGPKSLLLANYIGNTATLGNYTLYNIGYSYGVTAVGAMAGYNTSLALNKLTYGVFLGAGSSAMADSLTNFNAIGYGTQVNASNQVVLGNTAITQTLLRGAVDIGFNGSPLSNLKIWTQNVITDHSGRSGLGIFTVDAYAANKGATIDLGGYADTVSGVVNVFASISGRKENPTLGDGSGYMEFAVSYPDHSLHRAAIFNSAKEFIIGDNTATDLGAYLLQVNGNSIITGNSVVRGTSTFDSTALFSQLISAKQIDLTNYNNGNIFSATFSAGNPLLQMGIEQSSGDIWIGGNATQQASTNNQLYSNSSFRPSRIKFSYTGTPLQLQVADLGTAGNQITWVNALSFSATGAATFASSVSATSGTFSSALWGKTTLKVGTNGTALDSIKVKTGAVDSLIINYGTGHFAIPKQPGNSSMEYYWLLLIGILPMIRRIKRA